MSEVLFAVESNIPLQPKSKYPWGMMQVGDSFFVPCVKTKPRQLSSRLASAIGTAKGKYVGMKFQYRLVYENSCCVGCRVWRVQ